MSRGKGNAMEDDVRIRLPHDMARALRQEAYCMGIDISEAVRKSLKDWLPDNYSEREEYVMLEAAEQAVAQAKTPEEKARLEKEREALKKKYTSMEWLVEKARRMRLAGMGV